MRKNRMSYQKGRDMLNAGEISAELFTQMQDEGLIGPSPVEERIAKFPEGLQGQVGSLFREVESFNASNADDLQLRLQVVEKKEASR